MPEKGHVHKLRRHTYKSGNVVYFCALPDCNVKINPALALGKRAVCWRCGDHFIMTEYSIRLAKPHCEKCHKPKEKRTEDRIEELDVERILLVDKIIHPATKDSASDLRSRLSGISSKEDEGDI